MVKSVLKALDILEVFSREEPILTLGQISERLGLPKSTAHNILKTLASRGYIERAEEGAYALGKNIISLTQTIYVNVDLRDRAAPLLREVSDSCHETVYLAVLAGDAGLYIYAVETPGRLLSRTAVGDRAPLHCTAGGKAILSGMSNDDVIELVSRAGLRRWTDSTIVDRDVLLEELKRVRERGYSTDCAEHEANVYCVAAPIREEHGNVIAGCSISGRDPEIVGRREEELSRRIMYAAQSISRQMGFMPKRGSALVQPI